MLDEEIDSPDFLLIPIDHPFHASYGEVSPALPHERIGSSNFLVKAT